MNGRLPRDLPELGARDRPQRCWTTGTDRRGSRLSKQERHTMRSIFIIVLGAIAYLCVADNAAAQTTNELLPSCQAVMKAAGRTPAETIDIPPAGVPCWYYMAAMQNASVLVDKEGKRLLGICAPADATLLDHVRIFVQYARRNQKDAPDNAAALTVMALSEAYPCNAN
jgi:Ssp1 endopeptidase immunity protein Rap1a